MGLSSRSNTDSTHDLLQFTVNCNYSADNIYTVDNSTTSNSSDPNDTPDDNFENICGNSTLLDNEFLLGLDVVRYGLPVIYILSILLSMSGNLFWIIFMWKSARCGRSSNVILILNLAVCDLIKATVVAPLRVIELYLSRYQYHSSDGMDCCRSMNFFTLFLALVGFHSVVAISQERLVLISFPFYARKWFSRNVALVTISVVWASSFLVSLPFSLLYSRTITISLPYGAVFRMCSISFFHSEAGTGIKVYTLVITIFYYFIPVLVVSVSYIKIFITLHKAINNLTCTTIDTPERITTKYSDMKIENESNSNKQLVSPISKENSCVRVDQHPWKTSSVSTLKIIQRRKTLAQMMLVVAVCFIFFQGPIFFLYLYLSFGYKIERNAVFTLILFKWFPMVSSMINPFVYSTGWKSNYCEVDIYLTEKENKKPDQYLFC
ncbi:hypothetical protein HELRODRAFT_167618 [Helobdella robusta]|uniref:G-protein coupled receptors family 1 profile domain-containing protein n=1 Tax=Helobdella robusta TaxID=6412 RepID=T1EZK6_HELRO|nr:hypothetical protein HELRODRAFT_167618 [Helobdella robusta]ESO11087.1 hypothetical protein HELRODRAFT_167618 [Helobdella robusta]